MNKTEVSTDPTLDCEALLKMCLDPTTHHEEVGKALLGVKAFENELKRSAAYWLLCVIATEIHRPHSAPRHVRRYLNHAYECADIEQFRVPYAKNRVEALRCRTQRSAASIGPTLKDGYLRRLAIAEIDLQELGMK